MPLDGGTSCPVGCGRRRAREHLMCRTCWREVPGHLQQDVHRTWRTWRRTFGDPVAFREYRAAADAAIAAVR